MKSFESTFAKAIHLILSEENQNDKNRTGENKTEKTAMDVIIWAAGDRGRGDWSKVVKGLQKEAGATYGQVVKSSLAAPGKARILMGKLGVVKPSSSKNPLQACLEILSQAVKNQIMSEAYGAPVITGKSLFVPFKSIEDEDADEAEGITKAGKSAKSRNLTVYIHLTLIGAYNARFLSIDPNTPVKFSATSQNARGVTITLS